MRALLNPTTFHNPSNSSLLSAIKFAERFGDCSANGPVLQGLVKPGNDLSRGCMAEDVVNIVILTVLQTKL